MSKAYFQTEVAACNFVAACLKVGKYVELIPLAKGWMVAWV